MQAGFAAATTSLMPVACSLVARSTLMRVTGNAALAKRLAVQVDNLIEWGGTGEDGAAWRNQVDELGASRCPGVALKGLNRVNHPRGRLSSHTIRTWPAEASPQAVEQRAAERPRVDYATPNSSRSSSSNSSYSSKRTPGSV